VTSCATSAPALTPIRSTAQTPQQIPIQTQRPVTQPTTQQVLAPISTPVTSTPVPVVASDDPSALKKIQSSWDGVVQHIRATNPVASTFLRAVSPTAIQNGALILSMQFPLHKTFFEKPETREMVTKAIKAVAGQDVTLTCQLQASSVSGTARQEQKVNQEADLLKNVQEVFGAKVS
jgi:hypothetical protein